MGGIKGRDNSGKKYAGYGILLGGGDRQCSPWEKSDEEEGGVDGKIFALLSSTFNFNGLRH